MPVGMSAASVVCCFYCCSMRVLLFIFSFPAPLHVVIVDSQCTWHRRDLVAGTPPAFINCLVFTLQLADDLFLRAT